MIYSIKAFQSLLLLFLIIPFSSLHSNAQNLRPGFDGEEFVEILKINAQLSEHSSLISQISKPKHSIKIYESQEIGLKNKWSLWLQERKVGIISLRGSTMDTESWLVNFFAAQIPAKGTLEISPSIRWNYEFSSNKRASVHAGYAFSSYFLLNDILPRIDSCYQRGIKEFIITGHSQGGGLSYMINAAVTQLQLQGDVPKDIKFKTYTSASPKPGNLYFAYDYENRVKSDWSLHIVSTEDWVPQSPFTVQTLADLPEVSPLELLESTINKQSLIKRLLLKGIYKKVTKPSDKAVDIYQKYLGTFMGKQIQKYYPEFKIPSFAASNEYVRTGHQIILTPDEAYYKAFDSKKSEGQFMLHHSTIAYYHLMKQIYGLD